MLLETFVDPRFHATVYRAANWLYLGESRGYRRTRQGYSNTVHAAKKVLVKALQTDARTVLSQPVLQHPYRQGGPKMMLSAQQMRSCLTSSSILPIRAAPRDDAILCTVLAIACRGHPVWDARL